MAKIMWVADIQDVVIMWVADIQDVAIMWVADIQDVDLRWLQGWTFFQPAAQPLGQVPSNGLHTLSSKQFPTQVCLQPSP